MIQSELATFSVDLHTHSTASDGLLAPVDLVRLAASVGLNTIALTDHDTTQGIDEALSAAAEVGIEVIPGVELSCSVSAGELHMLGYFIGHHSTDLQEQLAAFREGRRDRVVHIIERLNDVNVQVDLARVRELGSGGSIGRAHVARALVESGAVSSMDEAFERYLSRGRPGYVERPRLTPAGAVELVHRSDGVAVLAHPYTVDGLDATLNQLVAAGLDGLEVYYGLYNSDQHARLARLARANGLVATGGSDFHGPGEREGRDIGTAPVPAETIELLRALHGRAH